MASAGSLSASCAQQDKSTGLSTLIMGHSRPRYNKAREEQMRLRKEGKRKQVDQPSTDNAEIIIPKSAHEKEEARRMKELQQRVSHSAHIRSELAERYCRMMKPISLCPPRRRSAWKAT